MVIPAPHVQASFPYDAHLKQEKMDAQIRTSMANAIFQFNPQSAAT